jgi:CRP/FNR family transcriptional regulator
MSPKDVATWSDELHTVIAKAFPESSREIRQTLVTTARVHVFNRNESILAQGDGSMLALVLRGHAAIVRTTADGHQLILRVVGRGDLAATMPFAFAPTAGDAIALVPTAAAFWGGPEVRSQAMADAGFAVDLLDQTLNGANELVERFESLRRQGSIKRVALVLYRYSDLFFEPEPVLTRAHLPKLIGTSREMTSRVLRALESRGIVARVGRDRLSLLDRGELARAAGIVEG